MRFFKSIGISLIGIIIVVVGFLFDALFVGIPYQDPTPELQAHFNFYSSIARILYKSGGVIFLAGLVMIPVLWRATANK